MKKYKKINHFESIAMKCTQEQFEEIKPILEKFELPLSKQINNFNTFNYLMNNYGLSNLLTNRLLSDVTNEIVYNKFNAKTFLKACGIVEKQPKVKITTELLKQLADNNSYSEELIKKEFPGGFIWCYKDKYKENYKSKFKEKNVGIAIVVKDLQGNILYNFKSISEASRFFKKDKSSIIRQLQNKVLKPRKYIYEYAK